LGTRGLCAGTRLTLWTNHRSPVLKKQIIAIVGAADAHLFDASGSLSPNSIGRNGSPHPEATKVGRLAKRLNCGRYAKQFR